MREPVLSKNLQFLGSLLSPLCQNISVIQCFSLQIVSLVLLFGTGRTGAQNLVADEFWWRAATPVVL